VTADRKTTKLALLFVVRLWGWNGTKFTLTEVIYWPIAPALHAIDGDDCGEISGKNECQGKLNCSEETCSIAAQSTTGHK
jgi:hypothetical protein